MLRRDSGHPFPWTTDPIFQTWRFCNVFRENDRSTTWLRRNVRQTLSDQRAGLALVQAIIIYRWFNRPEVGDLIKDLLLTKWSTDIARSRLRHIKPVTTGAYMLRTPTGYDKLEGIFEYIRGLQQDLPRVWKSRSTLQGVWEDLKSINGLGPFLAAEVVQDLRWTYILENAPDINTWTNAGPGCARGLGVLLNDNKYHFDKGSADDQKKMLALMIEILQISRDGEHWLARWPPWELHTVEFWACEFAKYRIGMTGERLKRRYSL
jgi:hypothetical protein